MPPKIKFYTNEACTEPFNFELTAVGLGESKSIPIFLKNEGDEPIINLVVSVESSRGLEVSTNPSSLPTLAPNEKVETAIRMVMPEMEGEREA